MLVFSLLFVINILSYINKVAYMFFDPRHVLSDAIFCKVFNIPSFSCSRLAANITSRGVILSSLYRLSIYSFVELTSQKIDSRKRDDTDRRRRRHPTHSYNWRLIKWRCRRDLKRHTLQLITKKNSFAMVLPFFLQDSILAHTQAREREFIDINDHYFGSSNNRRH